MAIRKIVSRSIGTDVIAAEDIAANAITVAEIQDGAVTPAKMHSTLDLSGKTVSLPASSVTTHVTQYDDNNVRNDIAVLNFQRAIDNNMGGYSAGDSFIDQFENENNIATQTNVTRVSERFGSLRLVNGPDFPITQFRWAKTGGTVYATWNFQGSNDGSNWTNLYTGYNMSGISGNGTWGSWASFTNTTNYLYYRFYKTNGASGGGYHTELQFRTTDGSEVTAWKNASYLTASGTSGTFAPENLIDGDLGSAGFHTDQSGVGTTFTINLSSLTSGANSATGSITSTDISLPSAVTEMGGVVLYKDTTGTATLNTDIVLKVSADGGSNYTTTTLSSYTSMSDGTKVAVANDETVTSGSTGKYIVELANQSDGVKETEISGVSLLY